MSVLDLHELVKFLEQKFSVSVVVKRCWSHAAGPAEEEKSTFNVKLADAGAQDRCYGS